MGLGGGTSWLLLIGAAYIAVALYWARTAAVQNEDFTTWFSAGHSLSPWVSALVLAGISVSAFFTLGTAQGIAQSGFVHGYLLQAGILLAIPGALLFKRAWFIAQRYRVSSQAELLRMYYGSDAIVVIVAAIAILFAVGFSGMQLRAVSTLIQDVSGGGVSSLTAGAALSILLFGYVVIGGMRAIGYLGVIQTVCLVSASLLLAALIIIDAGFIAAINARLLERAAAGESALLFEVAGVIQFVAGLGRGSFFDHPVTAITNLSGAYALLGIGAGPVALKVILSTRSTRGIAAGQTWVLAGFFGLLIVLPIAAIGAAGIGGRGFGVPTWLTELSATSPWFAAWIVLGFAAAMQAFAGLSILVAAETLIRHIWKPYYASHLDRAATVTLTRVTVVIITIITVLMAFLAPVTTSAIGTFALPASVQLLVPMLGLCWFGWMTPAAVLAGLGFGLFGAFVTDVAGIGFLSWLGLDLPWGRSPWSVNAAAWGLGANAAVCLLVSAVSQKAAASPRRSAVQAFLSGSLAAPDTVPYRSYAWAAGLAWMFLAVGPGLVFGSYAFVVEDAWILGFPSLWGWAMLFWLLGVVLVWALSYKMKMASYIDLDIDTFEPPPTLQRDTRALEAARLRNTLIALLVAGGLTTLTVWSFGGAF
ncbi:sodium:solute symporter family transporter [Roseovarius sp. D0-M9]|uniref:sodium:solute symporter family transporter n=1 Tax=Roseovarius sp. D0-M9 TaxID=3127117 RepID=UPI00300FE58E